jgi:glycosyltransferase involved in cell wall biosynthesis
MNASTKEKKILFLGHDASRTGAPIVLLNLLQWLKQNTKISFEILLKSGGPMESDFSTLAPTKVLKLSRLEYWLHKICKHFGWKIPAKCSLSAKAFQFAREGNFDLIYANTVAVAEEVEAISKLTVPIIWHIHELSMGLETHGGQSFLNARRLVHSYIAASVSVQQVLIETYSIPEKSIKIVHEFISSIVEETVKKNRKLARKELGLPENAFVVGTCGGVIWRKGPDLFINVAKHLATEFKSKVVHLIWIGAWENTLMQNQIEYDIQMAGLADRVRFIGVKSDSIRYLAALDVFALLSREDPFPLVMLEAAALGLPVVCFGRSGGGPEFVGNDAGIVIEYADTLAMARAFIGLSDQPTRRLQLGTAARQKVTEQYTIEIQAPKIFKAIEQALASPPSCMPESTS